MHAMQMTVLQSTSRSFPEKLKRILEKPESFFVNNDLNNKNSLTFYTGVIV
jgi:hypothetical protein